MQAFFVLFITIIVGKIFEHGFNFVTSTEAPISAGLTCRASKFRGWGSGQGV